MHLLGKLDRKKLINKSKCSPSLMLFSENPLLEKLMILISSFNKKYTLMFEFTWYWCFKSKLIILNHYFKFLVQVVIDKKLTKLFSDEV